ncbi:ribosomal RNA-processing protein 7-domain-containing protein [Mycena alexandri]|uniref:Ribosomal RNA-processing protein 7-domain-containing protein n=1 Tax=Mycena alexandri TaxID=1745969 RepID=A0AAD6SQ57_9AGAR|nr:ribosomal RNA-processing protein 7-domain-containing protein [Mycena alexandri]
MELVDVLYGHGWQHLLLQTLIFAFFWTAMSLPSSIAGFSVLPISYTGTSTHYLYARSHTGSKKNASQILPEGRTLFLVNVPPDATERELVLLFKGCGTVEKVVFDLDPQEKLVEPDDSDEEEEDEVEEAVDETEENSPGNGGKLSKNKPQPPKIIPLPSKPLRRLRPTGRSAHLVFLDASSLERALAPQPKARPWPASEEPSGVAHYAALFDSLRPPLDTVRAHADSAMELFEFELKQTKQQSKYRKGEAIVDEDGFTLVTRGGAYGQTLGGGVGKEPQQKAGFYAFQKAEKQRNDLMELKKNWEADKAKVEKLKASRRFKPY